MITDLFHSHILNMNRGSLHTRSLGHIDFSFLRLFRTKNGFTDPKGFLDFREKPQCSTKTTMFWEMATDAGEFGGHGYIN